MRGNGPEKPSSYILELCDGRVGRVEFASREFRIVGLVKT
jgi:hypothetical protein